MAIYHLTVKTITRSKGQSAVRSAAYRHAALMYDERLGKLENYTHKKDVIHCEITIPLNSPQWLNDLISLESEKQNIASEKLWNIVELREKQEKSQVAREIEFALPIELNQEQSINLTREFITDQFALRGMVADWSVHWDEGNPHVHVMLTMRELNQKGFGNKCRIWNHKTFLNEWRKSWAEYANFHLKLNHFDVRIDHRSYQDQGIDLIPTIHQGKAVNDMERRGIKTSIMRESNQIKIDNLKRIAKNPECLLKKVTSQKTSFTHQDVIENMNCYITDNAHLNIFQQTNRKQNGILASEALLIKNNEDQEMALKPVLTGELIKQILNNIEYHESVFSQKELVKELSKYTDNADAFARALIEVKASSELIYIGLGEDGRDRYTTQKMFNVESKLQILSEQIYERNHVRISEKRISEILDTYQKSNGCNLTSEQIDAVKHLASKSSLSCMVGRAGTGKSFTLGAARALWQAQGLNVYGVALSGVAASGLKQSAGIESRTIESFNYLVKNKRFHLSKTDVLVMDEAGMTDSVAMLNILEEVHRAKAKLVLVGDPQQLQPVGPGATFRAILERVNFCEIQTIYRQKVEWQRHATSQLSLGKVVEGLQAYDTNCCIHLSQTPYDAKNELVSNWLKLQKTNNAIPYDILVIAYKNVDVDELNQMIRDVRLKGRDITEGISFSTVKGELNVSINERLIFTKKDNKLGVENGSFATVVEINNNELTIRLDSNDNQLIKIDTRKYNHFYYGYAATVHKVQGATFDHSLIFSSGFGWDKQLTYVALSRHRESCHIYTDKESYSNKQKFYDAHNKLQIKDSILDYPLAFAQRRGLNIREDRGIFITNHLKSRLKNLVRHIKDNIEEAFNPEKYWARKEALAQESQQAEITLQRREDAKLVAEYVDANRALGKAFAAYQDKLIKLGITKLDYGSETTIFVLESQEYKDLYNAQIKRDSLAFQINKHIGNYSKALEIYGIINTKITKQSDRHLCRERVKEYAKIKRLGQIIKRDKLAADIIQNLKAHYAYLSYLKLDSNELHRNANAHQRREIKVSLNHEQRAAFNDVMHYQECTRNVAKLIEKSLKYKKRKIRQKIILEKESISFRELMTKEIYLTIEKRNQLAKKITSNFELYQPGLDFYKIGVGDSLKNNKNSNVIKQANMRWYKLQEHAAKGQEMQIKQPKSIEEKQWLRYLKRYQIINRKAGKAWSNIIKAKNNEKVLADLAKRNTAGQIIVAKRNYLAYLAKDQQDTLAILNEFNEISPVNIDEKLKINKINAVKLEQHANQHTKNLQTVNEWHDLYQTMLFELKQIIKPTTPYSNETHQSFMKLINRAKYKMKQLSENKSYQYALMTIGETSKSIIIKSKNISILQELTNQYLLQKRELSKINENTVIQLDKDQKRRIMIAIKTAKESLPIKHTLAEKYLRKYRNIQGVLPNSLRFHPGVYDPQTKQKYPALISISKNILGKIQAVQVIYLDKATGKKADIATNKRTYGVLSAGKPIVLINQGVNKEKIVVAEGVETALSIKEADPNFTIYATLGSSNFKHIPITRSTKSVLFCADNDGINSASQKKIKEVAENLSMKGINVYQIMPREFKQDFNDVLKNESVKSVREYLKNAELISSAINEKSLQQEISHIVQNVDKSVEYILSQDSYDVISDNTWLVIIKFVKSLNEYEEFISLIAKSFSEAKDEYLEVHNKREELSSLSQSIIEDKTVWGEIKQHSVISYQMLGKNYDMKILLQKIKDKTITNVELGAIKTLILDKSNYKSKFKSKGKKR